MHCASLGTQHIILYSYCVLPTLQWQCTKPKGLQHCFYLRPFVTAYAELYVMYILYVAILCERITLHMHFISSISQDHTRSKTPSSHQKIKVYIYTLCVYIV